MARMTFADVLAKARDFQAQFAQSDEESAHWLKTHPAEAQEWAKIILEVPKMAAEIEDRIEALPPSAYAEKARLRNVKVRLFEVIEETRGDLTKAASQASSAVIAATAISVIITMLMACI